MPTYTRVCQVCGQRFEWQVPILQRDADAPCVVCGGVTVRVPDAPAFKVAGGIPTHYPR